MTAPIEPTPVAPAAEPTPQTAEPAAPSPETPEFDPSTLSPEVKAYLKAEVAKADLKARTTSKQNAAQEARTAVLAEFAAKLGLSADGTPADPDEIAAQMSERAEAAEARLWTLGVKSAVYDQAAEVGAHAKLIYNSAEFRDQLDDLVDADPDDPDVRAQIAQKMRDFVAANPEYAAAGQAPAPTTPRPDPSQGARGPAITRPTSLGDAVAMHLAQQTR